MSLESREVQCPYCGETIEVDIEILEEAQSFIEDCSVCCRPIQFEVRSGRGEDEEVEINAMRAE